MQATLSPARTTTARTAVRPPLSAEPPLPRAPRAADRPARPARPRVTPRDPLDLFAGDRCFVMSFARGMSVIQAFAHVSRPLSIADISHRIDIPRAAVRRLLHTLCELGYVQVAGLRYTLAPKTLELGNAFTSSNDIAIGVQPIVTRLAERLHGFCALSVPENDDAMLMCLAGSSIDRVARRLAPCAGSKAPFYASASGLLFLAGFSDAQLDAYFERVALLPFTVYTQTAEQQVRDSLQRVRAQGYAVCDRALASDLRSIAVPVHDPAGAVVAAMVAVVDAERLSGQALHETLLPALSAAARQASQRWR